MLSQKRAVKPAAERSVVGYICEQHNVSERHACRLAQLHRFVARYTSQPRNDDKLRKRLIEMAEQYPRYGYLMLHGLLRGEKLEINKKRTYRINTEENLQVRTKRRKKLIRTRVPMAVPTKVNERWSMDFVSDQLACGRRIRIFNIVDDYSRECVGQYGDTSISGLRVAQYLDSISSGRSLPKTLVCDNGTEFTSKAMFFWSRKTGVKLHFIHQANQHRMPL